MSHVQHARRAHPSELRLHLWSSVCVDLAADDGTLVELLRKRLIRLNHALREDGLRDGRLGKEPSPSSPPQAALVVRRCAASLQREALVLT